MLQPQVAPPNGEEEVFHQIALGFERDGEKASSAGLVYTYSACLIGIFLTFFEKHYSSSSVLLLVR